MKKSAFIDCEEEEIETCSESEEKCEEKCEEDPICFQEYLGMLRDIVTAVESGESFDKIKITYCKTDWDKIKKRVREFENAKLPSEGIIDLKDLMIKKQFTTLEILKRILAYYN